MKSLELDAGSGEIRILFRYDAMLVEVVRALPGRRWHPEGRYWSVPESQLGAAAARLLPLGFALSVELRDRLGAASPPFDGEPAPAPAGTGTDDDGQGGADVPDGGPAPRREHTLSISELNDLVRGALQVSFPAPLWIEGEVLGYDRNAHKKHVYFQLADKEEGSERPRAVVTVVLFAGVREQLAFRIARAAPASAAPAREAPDDLRIRDGIRIRVRGRVDLYPPSGTYQLIVEDLDPEFTLGDLARRRERILAEIERQGVLEHNRRLAFPVPALRIGLVTSYESDAYNDFVNELGHSGYAFSVDVCDVHVQGREMEADLLAALAFFAARAADYDAVAIVRGGGARSDLMDFDSLAIGLAVARHPVKVIAGIGHFRDQSVVDFVAHSEKTPTACAQHLVALAGGEAERLRRASEETARFAERTLVGARERLARSNLLMTRSLDLLLARGRAWVDRRARDLELAFLRPLERRRGGLGMAQSRLLAVARGEMARGGTRHATAQARIGAAALAALSRAEERLAARGARTAAADPRRILARGYAWLVDERGRSVKRAVDVHAGDRLRARLADGELDLRVDETRPDEGKNDVQ